jgi:hypothetical protein
MRTLLEGRGRISMVDALEQRRLLSNGVSWNEFYTPADIARFEAPRQRNPGNPTPVPDGITPGPNAPVVSGTIEGVGFDTNASTAGFYSIPSDTHGAAGPNHVMNVTNYTVEWYTKAGALQNRLRLGRNSSTAAGSFFEPLAPANALFDPKVLWDQHNNRFVVVALEYRDTARGDSVNSSRILLAVSDDADPNGTWFYTQTNSVLNVGGVNRWADYPSFGMDASNLYVTCNMFGFGAGSGAGSRLWIFPKSTFYSGTPATFPTYNVFNPGTAAGIGSIFAAAPAHSFGSLPAGVGTYLVTAGLSSGATDFLSVITVSSGASPTFTNTYLNLGDITNGNLPGAPQLGSATTIEAGDTRIQTIIARNNNLYVAHTINPSSGTDVGQATVRYYRLSTSGSISVAETGNIGGESISAGAHTYYPSLAVNNAGDIAINFCFSSPTTFAGLAYTVRQNGVDPSGVPQPPTIYADGIAAYVRQFNGGRNRWGDYTAITVDPANESRFWAYGVYALAQGTVINGENGRWGSRWGNFFVAGTPPLAPSTPDLTNASDSGSSTFDNITNINTPTFTGTAEIGVNIAILFNGVSVATGTADTSGNWTVTIPARADGTYVVTAVASNTSGPSQPSGPVSVVIDTVAPTTAFSFTRSPAQSVSYTFSESFASGSTLSLTNTSAGGTFATNPVTVSAVTLRFDVIGNALTDGRYTASLTGVTDLAGNAALPPTSPSTFRFLRADFNGDFSVNFSDLLILAQNYNLTGTNNLNGDADYNGSTGFNDLLILAQTYNTSLLSTATRSTAGAPPRGKRTRTAVVSVL